ncbi:Uncharacterised protein [Candidatus Burarchaeum australiense]|nr:Uncharacterised protein [Candidatus Burarchaeum australiense]
MASYCSGGTCKFITIGECGYVQDHQWFDYQCCSDSACQSDEFCDLDSHTCRKKPIILPPFQCKETCEEGGSGICCSGYCEAGVCRLRPPTAAAVTLPGGVEIKSACAGLDLGLDALTCNLLWLILLILATMAGYVGSRQFGRLQGVAFFLLPIFVGLISYASLGILLALIELVVVASTTEQIGGRGGWLHPIKEQPAESEEPANSLLSFTPNEKIIYERYGKMGVQVYHLIDDKKDIDEISKEVGISKDELVDMLDFMEKKGIVSF